MRSSLLFSTLTGLATAAQPLIVGLGSSYAAGPGLTKPIGKLLAEKLSSKQGVSYAFSNIAVNGSELHDLTTKQAPKLQDVKADLIYLVSGGNDLRYVTCLDDPNDSECDNLISETTYKERYVAALDSIVDHTNHDTTLPIYAITYMTAVDSDSNCNKNNAECPLDNKGLTKVKDIHNKLVDWTLAAVKEWQSEGSNSSYQVKIVPMREHSIGHHVGSQQPWVNGAYVQNGAGGIDWHPNNAGAEAVASYIYNDVIGN